MFKFKFKLSEDIIYSFKDSKKKKITYQNSLKYYLKYYRMQIAFKKKKKQGTLTIDLI